MYLIKRTHFSTHWHPVIIQAERTPKTSKNGVNFVLTKWTPFSVNVPTVDWELFARKVLSPTSFRPPCIFHVVAVPTSPRPCQLIGMYFCYLSH
jgi:hypothetical protein